LSKNQTIITQQQDHIAKYSAEFNTGNKKCKKCKLGFYYSIKWSEEVPDCCGRCKKELDIKAQELIKNTPKQYNSDSINETNNLEKLVLGICATIVISLIVYIIL